MEKRLLVLGAGRHQKNLIIRAEKRGIRVVVSDYLPDSPGKQFSTYPTNIDALDIKANIELGKKHHIAGVITTGMDMAVVTMAAVAEALGLPCYLSLESAKISTNKLLMKKVFQHKGLPIVPYYEVNKKTKNIKHIINKLELPIVVKPADSQGQRGIQKVTNESQVEQALRFAINESRTDKAIIEQYVSGYEVTVNAWVDKGEVKILMINDRITYNPSPFIGIAFQHIFPSATAAKLEFIINEIMQQIMHAYGIKKGPLYVQMIIKGNEIYTVEAACRIGGGHEDCLFQTVSGINVFDRLIDLALEGVSKPINYEYDEKKKNPYALVNFLLAYPGIVSTGSGFERLLRNGMIVEGEYYYSKGYRTGNITNSLARVGYFILKDSNRENLLERAKNIYNSLHLIGQDGTKLLFWPPDYMMIGSKKVF